MIKNDLRKEFSDIMNSKLKEHYEIHKEKVPISLSSYMFRMIDEAYFLGRIHKVEEDMNNGKI